jgi:RNA polymerase sigma-70 factor (ECF subfamily)
MTDSFSGERRDARFVTTNWSCVLAARQSGEESRRALSELCQSYWYPLYAFLRRSGCAPDDAQDVVQGFFLRLIERDYLSQVDRQRGRFRSFLLAAIRHFLSESRRFDQAIHRGGGAPVASIDFSAGERRYALEPADSETAEKLFERRWATTILEQALAKLGEEHAARGQASQFSVLRSFLVADSNGGSVQQAADALNLTPGATRVTIHRLRKRYRELIREQIARTVTEPGDVEAELRDLFQAMATP